ncbi:MAG: glycosyltransferase family 4 protein [Pseudomonadota bacterium]
MRLLLVNYEYPPLGGGAGNATARLAEEMAARGVAVKVITSGFAGLPREEVSDGVEIVRLPVVRRRLDRSNVLEMLTFLVASLTSGVAAARRFKPDAAIAFFGLPCGPPAFALKALDRTPYLISFRGGDVPGFQEYDLAFFHRMTGPLLRFLWKRADGLVANSKGLALLAREFEPTLPVRVIPNGVDTALFQPVSNPAPSGPCRLLFVGRLQYQKGVDVLLKAQAMLPSDLRCRLTLVGDGPARNDLERMVHTLGLSDSTAFLGWKSRADLPAVYQACDVLVLPSRDEGMPNVVLEAMASGLPVVATAISGNEELVETERTGLLVPKESVPELAGALARLSANVAFRRDLGAAGRARAIQEYTWGNSAEAYLELIQRIVKSNCRL